VVGSVMGGYDGHRGWIYALAVKPSHRRRGIASALMHAIERRLAAAGCGKLNLQVRASNSAVIAFYEALGFAVEARVSMGKRLDGSGP
jgi:ribosomal protein S18 acetylase RimI-like enzyme